MPYSLKIALLTCCLFFVGKQNPVFCQEQENEDLEYDQFTIKLNVDKLGVYEMEAVYYNDNIYLPIIELFGKLEIYLNHSVQLDTIEGYILNKENAYSVNSYSGKITFQNKEKVLTKDQLISTFKDVYIPGKIYQEMFGMTMDFNFRELTVFLRSDIELPVIKQLRIKSLRKNLSALNGEISADTVIRRKWNWISGAVIDWSLQSKEDLTGANEQQFKSSLGMEILGGELNCRSTIVRDSSIRFQSTTVKWRYVNDRIPVLKQIEAGNLNVSLSGQTSSNFCGIKLTNSPYAIRKTFGSYFIERKTNPGWDVELYVNGVLVNFTTADMNGYFNFEVPLVFGSSIIVIRYYGPWGQESVEEIPINIPFSFTAHKQFEYQTFTGITADTSRYLFNKTKLSYGLARWATLNAGYEYFKGNTLNPHIFSGSLNVALGRNLLLSYSYLHTSNHSIELLYRSKHNFILSGKHRQYVKQQTIIQTPNIAESELNVNFPLLNRKMKIYLRSSNRGTYNRNGFSFISESALSFFYKRVNTSFTFIGSQQSALTWNTTVYFKKNWSVIHNSMYNISNKRAVSSMIQLQKRFNKQFFAESGLTYSYASNEIQLNLSLYFNFNFMRSSVSTTIRKKELTSTQNLAGSIHITSGPKPVFASNSNNVGMSGLDVVVFLDINHNDKRDKNEPLIKNASVAINRGKQIFTDNDTIHRFVSLEPYSSYLLTVANNGFSSISWVLEKETWSVTTDPNQIKKILIPVKPMGEIALTVSMKKKESKTPAKRLIVYLSDQKGQIIAKGLTEQDGSFSYLGLIPGKYEVKFDEKQLKGLGLSSEYPQTSFEIKISAQGDFVDGIEITLQD